MDELTPDELLPPGVTRCDTCGAEFRVGAWPFCPHGEYRGSIIPDTLPGGAQWIENLGNEPVWVETKTQLHREAAARGLRWTPNPQRHGTQPHNPESHTRGRFNGGALPTYKETHRPAPELPKGHPGDQ